MNSALRTSRTVQRICIIGSTGSGKTSLARAVAACLAMPRVELDALHWDPNWTEASDHVFRERVAEALSGDRWVVDGNYSRVHDFTIQRADAVVWIDLPFHQTLWRLAGRTFRRWWTREELWRGNRERLATQFLSRDSIFYWLITSYPRRKRQFPELLRRCAARGQLTFRLKSQREVDAWVRTLRQLAAATSMSS
jgi:adenylate kinase family enzyme